MLCRFGSENFRISILFLNTVRLCFVFSYFTPTHMQILQGEITTYTNSYANITRWNYNMKLAREVKYKFNNGLVHMKHIEFHCKDQFCTTNHWSNPWTFYNLDVWRFWSNEHGLLVVSFSSLEWNDGRGLRSLTIWYSMGT